MLVPRVSCATGKQSLPSLSHRNWVEADGVDVSFNIEHRGSSILLRYIVREPQVRAVNTGFNSAVWEDSCVEFFLALDGDPNYYNFEFSAIGTVLGGYGPDRNKRQQLPEILLEQVQTMPSLGNEIIENLAGDIQWELDIVIPVSVLIHNDLEDLAGMKARANFYKCGDGLKKPHFLSWKPVATDKPDFHRPDFFGDLEFAP